MSAPELLFIEMQPTQRQGDEQRVGAPPAVGDHGTHQVRGQDATPVHNCTVPAALKTWDRRVKSVT